MAENDESRKYVKLIKRYVALMIAFAGFEIEQMKKMNLKLELHERMAALAQEHATKYQDYEPNVSAVDVIEQMKNRRNKTANEQTVDGDLLWRRFREIKRIVVNDITRTFLKTLTNGKAIPSGSNLSSCLEETRKRLFETKKPNSELAVNAEADSTAGKPEDVDDPESLKSSENCALATSAKSLLKTPTDNVSKPGSSYTNWYPPEWLVFITLGLPVQFLRSSKYAVADAFKLTMSEGLPGNESEAFSCGDDFALDGSQSTRPLPLSRKRQREIERKNYSKHGFAIKKRTEIEEDDECRMDPDIVQSLVRKIDLRAKELHLETARSRLSAAKDLYEAAKDMGDIVGKLEAYERMKLAAVELDCLCIDKPVDPKASSITEVQNSVVDVEPSTRLLIEGHNQARCGLATKLVEGKDEKSDSVPPSSPSLPPIVIEREKSQPNDLSSQDPVSLEESTTN